MALGQDWDYSEKAMPMRCGQVFENIGDPALIRTRDLLLRRQLSLFRRPHLQSIRHRPPLSVSVSFLLGLCWDKAQFASPLRERSRRSSRSHVINLPRLFDQHSWPERQIFSTTRVTGSRPNPMSQGGSDAHGMGRSGSRGCSQ
jgi:hypothetical protein